MEAKWAMIAWTPAVDGFGHRETKGKVQVGRWPDREGWSDGYAFTGGACYSTWRDAPEWQLIALLFINFHSMVVRDGIDPKVAHEAFLEIDEYRARISPDIKGADPE